MTTITYHFSFEISQIFIIIKVNINFIIYWKNKIKENNLYFSKSLLKYRINNR